MKRAAAVCVWALISGCVSSRPESAGKNLEVSRNSRAWPVMGTVFSIATWNEKEIPSDVYERAYEEVARVDSFMSTYKPESEISQINERAGSKKFTPVSIHTLAVIEKGLQIETESEGGFNLAVGALVSLWGFHQPLHGEERKSPNTFDIAKALGATKTKDIQILRKTREVHLNRKGMRLDFGGIAKGYALDLAAAALEKDGIQGAELNLGEQLRFVGKPPSGSKWIVDVRDPGRPEKSISSLEVDGGSVSTSGGYGRYFVENGKTYGHILDPRSGIPVGGVRSVTVWAPTGIEADAWSTALFVSSSLQRQRWAKSHPHLRWIWVGDHKIETVRF